MYPSKTNNFDKWQMQNAYVINYLSGHRQIPIRNTKKLWMDRTKQLASFNANAQHATTTLSLMQIAQHVFVQVYTKARPKFHESERCIRI